MSKVLNKIEKLLALAAEEGGGTEGERNNAAEKAQKLMLEHRISLDDLEKAKGREALPGIERESYGELSQSRYWVYDLLNSIGEEVQVDAIFVGSLGSKRVSLVGRPDMIAYVKLLAEWLEPQLVRECEVALKEAKAEPGNRWERYAIYGAGELSALTMAFRRSFYEAAVAKIHHRLSMARREAGEKGTALVRSDRAAIDEFYGDRKPKTTEKDVYTGSGTTSGIGAGARADINPGNKVGTADRKELDK